MNNLLTLIAIVLIVAWAVGYIGFKSGGIVHVLLIIAAIAVIFRVIRGDRYL